MFELDPKLLQAIAPSMERILIIDPATASTRILVDLLQNIWPGQIWKTGSTSVGLSMAQTVDPQLIFVEYAGEGVDGLGFTRRLRRSELACRKAPVVMVTGQATPAVILGARDAGVHEFLRKPFTNKDLIRRIEAVARYPRGWVEAVGYVGPDRRRFNSADYKGSRKRRTDTAEDPQQARVIQALKIIASAVHAMETDPRQAFRAINAQLAELQAVGGDDGELTAAVADMLSYLQKVAIGERMERKLLEPLASRIIACLPASQKAGQAARARTAA